MELNIGARLQELRATTTFTQKELAKELGSNQATIARVENNNSIPSPKLLIAYADYFSVSLDWIFCRCDKPQGQEYSNENKEFKMKMQNKKEWESFVKACFEPNSALNKKLQESILKLSEGK